MKVYIFWEVSSTTEKATKFCKTSTVDLTVTMQDTSKVEMLQNFVTLSEYMNFDLPYSREQKHVSNQRCR